MHKRKRCAVNIDIFELISKYRDNECLWDWNNKDYRNKGLKKKVWERIARHFRTEMTVVKTKVRFLRTAYVSEKKKVDKAKRLGESPYIPGLFYYKYLSFLDDVVICRKAEEELELENVNDYECEKVEISQDCEENNEIENFTKTELVELDLPPDQEYSPEPTQVSPVAGYGVVDVVELISKYKDYECLWNIHNKDYKHKGVRNLAWESIARHFGKEVSEVKNKVRRLRTAYVSEKRKIERTKKHRPTLFYYKHLTFLDDVVVCRSGADDLEKTKDFEQNNDNRRYNDSDFDNMETNDEYFSKKEDVKGSPVSSSTPSSPREPQHKISAPKILSTRSLRNRTSKRQSERELKYKKAVNDVETSSRNISKHNIYSSFGTTIALQLEQLPLEEATITMSEIHTMITKKILNYFKFSHNGHHNQLKYSDEECYDDILQAAINEANL